MIDVVLAPKHYVQREGILAEAGDYLKRFGRRPLVLSDELVFSIVRPTLEERFKAAGMQPAFALFGEECSFRESARLENIARETGADLIVGTGGGRAIDTARLVAHQIDLPLISIPTSAATCSAASAAAVVYDQGVRETVVDGKGADLVLVDSGVIARAPTRLLIAGMADAITKWYEGRHCYNKLKGFDTAIYSAMHLSIMLRENVFSLGLEAKRDVDARQNSDAVEAIIECNILLTGIISAVGGSNFRVAVPHALLYGMTVVPGIHRNLHGEMVGYGIIVQLCMEKNEEELEKVIPFFSELGLPLTMKELGLPSVEDLNFQAGLRKTCATGSAIHNMPFPVNETLLEKAMIEADQRAASFRT